MKCKLCQWIFRLNNWGSEVKLHSKQSLLDRVRFPLSISFSKDHGKLINSKMKVSKSKLQRNEIDELLDMNLHHMILENITPYSWMLLVFMGGKKYLVVKNHDHLFFFQKKILLPLVKKCTWNNIQLVCYKPLCNGYTKHHV